MSEEKRQVEFQVSQYIDGNWVLLINIETECPGTEEEIEDGLEALRKLIFKGESVYISNEDSCVMFSRKNGPVKIDVVNVEDKCD